MDEVTQQNAALVEELSAASQAMSLQMQALRDAVSMFQLERQADATSLVRTPRRSGGPRMTLMAA